MNPLLVNTLAETMLFGFIFIQFATFFKKKCLILTKLYISAFSLTTRKHLKGAMTNFVRQSGLIFV